MSLTGHTAGTTKFPYPDRAIVRPEFHCSCGVEPGAPGFRAYFAFIWRFLRGDS